MMLPENHSLYRGLFLPVFLLLMASTFVQAQVITPGSDQYDYLRILQLRQDSIPLYYNHFDFIRYDAPDDIRRDWWGLFDNRLQGNGVRMLPVYTRMTYNSAYDRSRNNGALWYGRGITQELHGGFQARYGVLNITMQPVIYYAQNRSFETGRFPFADDWWADLPPRSEFAYPYEYNIDYVQRFGDRPFVRLHPGQSDINIHVQNVRFGVSTQNMQLGQSMYSTLTMGPNAPGLLHAYVQNPRPIYLWIGHGEFKQTWGIARESGYFDAIGENNLRYFTSISAGWVVHYLPGLQLGFNRVFMKRGSEFNPLSADWLATLHHFNSGINVDEDGFEFNDDYFQMTSITGRWTFPEVNFEAYFEYVRNDFGGGPFGPTPEHSRAYTLGMTALYPFHEYSFLALTAEISTNGSTRTEAIRSPASYYIHSIVEHGFTNEGQLMGSYIGPGGTAFNVFLRHYSPRGMHGFTIDYLRRDEDIFFRYPGLFGDIDHEFTLGYRGVIQRNRGGVGSTNRQGLLRQPRGGDIGIAVLRTWRKNMHMVAGNHVNQYTLSVSLTF